MDQSVHRFKSLSSVCRAIASGDMTLAGRLIDREGPDGFEGLGSDQIGESPVMMALSTGHPGLARKILAAGYEPDFWEASALNMAGVLHEIALKRPDILNLCNAEGWSPMHLACYAHADTVLAVLCEFDADPNVVACNNTLETPLHSAVRTDDPGLIETLLAAGADPRFTDAAGRTPLQLAIELASARAGAALALASA
ncbi:MAG: ankyrin repeat domain-containing protein [Phycisphaera sp.]|nr:MAG: ankyrin repeat domain-containing protein [Phycisphaera sp.]